MGDFPNLDSPGTLYSSHGTATIEALGNAYAPVPGALASDLVVQQWNVEFSGTLGGPAVLTLCYDDQTLGFPEDTLRVAHWREGEGWEFLTGVLDTGANTFQFNTDSFSPFVIVPEPASLAILISGGMALIRRRRRL